MSCRSVVCVLLVSLRSYDGNCNENVTLKKKHCDFVFCDCYFRLLGTNGHHVKAKNERFNAFIFPHSTNQIIGLWRSRCRVPVLKLPSISKVRRKPIGHFRITFGLFFKASPGAHLFI